MEHFFTPPSIQENRVLVQAARREQLCVLGGEKCSIMDIVRDCMLLKTKVTVIGNGQNHSFPQLKKGEDEAKGL